MKHRASKPTPRARREADEAARQYEPWSLQMIELFAMLGVLADALEYAEAANAANASPHTEQTIAHVRAAIETGKQSHADAAQRVAEALDALEMSGAKSEGRASSEQKITFTLDTDNAALLLKSLYRRLDALGEVERDNRDTLSDIAGEEKAVASLMAALEAALPPPPLWH